jgi:caa(3)-type oxidase subunit IV
MSPANKSPNVIAKYLPVYFALLCISMVQVLVSYQHFSMIGTLTIFLLLATASAGLAVMYFMHLAKERRSLFLTLIPAVIFVLLMMNMIWSDGYRLLHLRPFPH